MISQPRMDTSLRRAAASLSIGLCAAILSGCTINASDNDGDGWGDFDDENSSAQAGDDRRTSAISPNSDSGTLPLSLTGQEVRVHLRRDALGMSGAGAVGLDADGPARDDLSIAGTYRGRDGGWIRIERAGGGMVYVPSGQVLAVETTTPSEGTTRSTRRP